MKNITGALFVVALVAAASSRFSDAFTAPLSTRVQHFSMFQLSSSKTESAATTKEAKPKDVIPDFSSSTQPLDESKIFATKDDAITTWQENLEALLAPYTAVAKRQIVLSDLLNAAPEIQESVRTALRERKVCVLKIIFVILDISFAPSVILKLMFTPIS